MLTVINSWFINTIKMTDKEREYYIKKYYHLNLYFAHGRGWDYLTLTAARELDSLWPKCMPNWFKRLNNYLLFSYGGRSVIKVTKFYHSKIRKLVPFIKEYPRFTQIKEKYGSLRLYSSYNTKIINILENASYEICEECGSSQKIGRTEGWIKTLCKNCALKEDNQLINWKENET